MELIIVVVSYLLVQPHNLVDSILSVTIYCESARVAESFYHRYLPMPYTILRFHRQSMFRDRMTM